MMSAPAAMKSSWTSRTIFGAISSAVADQISVRIGTPRFSSSRPVPPSSRSGRLKSKLLDIRALLRRNPPALDSPAAVQLPVAGDGRVVLDLVGHGVDAVGEDRDQSAAVVARERLQVVIH